MTKAEDQGRGVLYSHLVIAEEYIRQNKLKKDDATLKKIVMKLAKEKAESYTPSEELGKNPESRVASSVQDASSPWLYGKSSIINSFGLSETEKKAFLIELDGALTHLVQIILKRVHGFTVTRSPSAKLSDPKQLTSFEYIKKEGSKLSPEERSKHDALVAVNRQIRGLMRSYLTASLIPLLNTSKEELYKAFQEIYQDIPTDAVKSTRNYKSIMKNAGSKFLITFGSTKITDYLKGLRFRNDGKLQIPGRIKKS